MARSLADLAKRVTTIANAVILSALALAIVVGCVAAGVSYYRHRNEQAKVRDAKPELAAPELQLSGFTPIGKSTRFRAELTELDTATRLASYPSGARTRNLLFADSATGAAQWLLPTNDERIVKLEDLPHHWNPDRPPPLVTVALVKPATEPIAAQTGRLLLLSPEGDRTLEVATGVREVSGHSLHVDPTGVAPPRLSIVYERDRRFITAQYDVATLKLIRESELALPNVR